MVSENYDEYDENLEDEEFEDEDFDEDEEDESVNWEDYYGYTFAHEMVNGEILSMKKEFQMYLKDKILEEFAISEDALKVYLNESDEELDSCFEQLQDVDVEPEAVAELLGYNQETDTFQPEGIGFLDSPYGNEAVELFDILDIPYEEVTEYAPHGHGGNGVCYIK